MSIRAPSRSPGWLAGALLVAGAVLAGCGDGSPGALDAGPGGDASALDAARQDAAPTTAAENILGVWQQPVTGYPDLLVIWAFAAAGWGNIDVRGSSGSWCRNDVSWEITSEQSPEVFTLAYTFEQPPCGNSSQGDTLTLHVLGQEQADPPVLRTDWGGGAQMTLCSRDLAGDDACAVGDTLGPPAASP